MQLPERGDGGELSTTMQEAQEATGSGKISIKLILPDGTEPTHEFQVTPPVGCCAHTGRDANHSGTTPSPSVAV